MYLMKTINKIIDDLTCIFASKRKTGVTTMTVHDICCINRTLRVLFHWQCVLPFGPSPGAPIPPLFAVHSSATCEIQTQPVKPWHIDVCRIGSGAERLSMGWRFTSFRKISKIYGYMVYVLSNHKRTFSVSMSHSNLATQWEAVGTLRDKARKLELAPSL